MKDDPVNDDRRWLDEPRNVDRVVRGLYVLCALVFLADLLYTKHPHFGIENTFGFYALYGFLGSVTLVLVAKELRRVLMRPEDYYERSGDDD
ncbi:hypothetical protein E1266_26965 [Actinomadura sp. 7K534]|nr:hypothetical protein E1266_26965 [Actinomadura sp. 7K534]